MKVKVVFEGDVKLDPEILKEVSRLKDHLLVEVEKCLAPEELNGLVLNLGVYSYRSTMDTRFYSSAGIVHLDHYVIPSEKRNNGLYCRVWDTVVPSLQKSASRLRERLKDRYPDQHKAFLNDGAASAGSSK